MTTKSPTAVSWLKRPWSVALWLVLASLLISTIVSRLNWPAPKAHDEFSYLLAADTFCTGRLANPTHRHWEHFESFHVFHQPTYASKYPPGQGAFMALGQWLTGQPIAGVWILSALAAAATYWMLLGWTSPSWALAGAVLWLVHPGYQLMWGQSYWGGTLAFLGGALVFGAALRMRHRAWIRDAVAMATGAVLLAVSRPYEGLIFCTLVGCWVLWHWIRVQSPSLRDVLLKSALPQAIVLFTGGLALATYHKAVTGHALTFPYIIHELAYAQCPMFHGQSPAKPEYRHAVIEDFHSGWAMDWYRRQSTFQGWLYTKFATSWYAWWFFCPPILAVAALFVRPWRWNRIRPAVVIAVVALVLSLGSVFSFAHYMAPFAPLVLMAVVAGLRRIDILSRWRLSGFRLAPALIALQAVIFVLAAYKHVAAPPHGWYAQRSFIADKLRSMPGRHLVVVRYGPEHSPHDEWVYNRADIDGAKIVWAREMGPARDAELVEYFTGYNLWLLEPDAKRLQPLTAASLVPEKSSASPLAHTSSH